jgi:hypothetical protein
VRAHCGTAIQPVYGSRNLVRFIDADSHTYADLDIYKLKAWLDHAQSDFTETFEKIMEEAAAASAETASPVVADTGGGATLAGTSGGASGPENPASGDADTAAPDPYANRRIIEP